MILNIENYRNIVGDDVLESIYKKADALKGKHILYINSTSRGGGVAEMLNTLIPIMNSLGVEVGWRILPGTPDFFTVTKKIHHALQGGEINLIEFEKKMYEENNELFSTYTHIKHDAVMIHDPQPLPLIKFYNKKQPWILRLHIDLSNPNPEVLDYLKVYMSKYDVVIVSNNKYKIKDLPVEQRVIYPAIDPLSLKNKEISQNTISKYLKKFGIKTDKPLITQISRFDKWKDPQGVIDVFKIVKREVDCRLILCGSHALDDPESQMVLDAVMEKSKDFVKNGDIIILNEENHILVNSLQRTSDVIIQKSIREGFGLTVSEALWKGTPVVASNVGGITVQIQDGVNGFLAEPHDIEKFAECIIELLKNPKLAKGMGEAGKKFVKDNFLITRLISDHLDVLYNAIRNYN